MQNGRLHTRSVLFRAVSVIAAVLLAAALLGCESAGADSGSNEEGAQEDTSGDNDPDSSNGDPGGSNEDDSSDDDSGSLANAAPTAAISAPATSVEPGTSITFDATGSSDADGSIVSYAWELGDGNTATGASVSHSYSSAGTYTVSLTVTDDADATATDTVSVTVAAAGDSDPVGSLEATINLVSPDDYTVNFGSFDGTLTKPNDTAEVSASISGGASGYRWYLDAQEMAGANAGSYTLDASAIAPGRHTLTVVATKDGQQYSGSIQFDVEN